MEQKIKKSNEEASELEKKLADTSIALEEKDKHLKFRELFIKDLEAEIARLKETNDSMTGISYYFFVEKKNSVILIL